MWYGWLERIFSKIRDPPLETRPSGDLPLWRLAPLETHPSGDLPLWTVVILLNILSNLHIIVSWDQSLSKPHTYTPCTPAGDGPVMNRWVKQFRLACKERRLSRRGMLEHYPFPQSVSFVCLITPGTQYIQHTSSYMTTHWDTVWNRHPCTS